MMRKNHSKNATKQQIAKDLSMDEAVVSWLIGDFDQINAEYLKYVPSNVWSDMKNKMSHVDKPQLKEFGQFMRHTLGELIVKHPDVNPRSMHLFWESNPREAIWILSSAFSVPIPEMFRVFDFGKETFVRESRIQIRRPNRGYLRMTPNLQGVDANGAVDDENTIWIVHHQHPPFDPPLPACGPDTIYVTLQSAVKHDNKYFLQIIDGNVVTVSSVSSYLIVHKSPDGKRIRFESVSWRGTFLATDDHIGIKLSNVSDELTWFYSYMFDTMILKYPIHFKHIKWDDEAVTTNEQLSAPTRERQHSRSLSKLSGMLTHADDTNVVQILFDLGDIEAFWLRDDIQNYLKVDPLDKRSRDTLWRLYRVNMHNDSSNIYCRIQSISGQTFVAFNNGGTGVDGNGGQGSMSLLKVHLVLNSEGGIIDYVEFEWWKEQRFITVDVTDVTPWKMISTQQQSNNTRFVIKKRDKTVLTKDDFLQLFS
eukprot:468772_1